MIAISPSFTKAWGMVKVLLVIHKVNFTTVSTKTATTSNHDDNQGGHCGLLEYRYAAVSAGIDAI